MYNFAVYLLILLLANPSWDVRELATRTLIFWSWREQYPLGYSLMAASNEVLDPEQRQRLDYISQATNRVWYERDVDPGRRHHTVESDLAYLLLWRRVSVPPKLSKSDRIEVYLEATRYIERARQRNHHVWFNASSSTPRWQWDAKVGFYRKVG